MESPTLMTSKTFVREFADGQAVDSVFVIRDLARRRRKNGAPFLKLQLGDVTGAAEAVAWDEVEEIAAVARPGAVVRVTGSFEVDPRYGGCLKLRSLRPAEAEEYDPADLLEGPRLSFDQMVADFRALVATVRNPHLQKLLERVFREGGETWRRFSEAPAAKRYHQAYRHGLLEHSLLVGEGVNAIAATFSEVDRDIAVAGALLHDIGKIEAYAAEGGAIELTDTGKLQGEIPLGYYLVRREIDSMPGFPADVAQAVLHIVLAHHGALEHGSPVTPCTREATLVHMIDNLGGRLGSFDRIERSLAGGERWSAFDAVLDARSCR